MGEVNYSAVASTMFVRFQNMLAEAHTQSRAHIMRHYIEPSSPEMKPALAAIGSATVAVLSQSFGVERPYFAMRWGHVVYNNCAIYMYKQQCHGTVVRE